MASVVLDIGKLVSEYSKHQVDWYNNGLQLGIKALDVIKHDYLNKAGDCFQETLYITGLRMMNQLLNPVFKRQ